MRLLDLASGRDNNFNLIRLIAAFAVLVTHSFAIVTGDPAQEPLRGWLGMTIGDFAVDTFFITSGFLVTASLANRRSAIEFACARFLRVYPALLVMLGLTVLVVGLALTSLPAMTYLSSYATVRYLVKCATLLFGIDYLLPGVFEGNPIKAVNGSLWSMPWEIRMYVLLLALWLCTKLVGKRRSDVWSWMVVATCIIALAAHMAINFGQTNTTTNHGLRLFFMFFTGGAFYVLRHRISLSTSAVLAAAVALGVATFHKETFFVVYNLTIAYVILWLAYVPGGFIRRFNSLGDYSYGTYIYAFPVQQITVALLPGISVAAMIFVSGAVTIVLAMASWYTIEKRALSVKERASDFARRVAQATLLLLPGSERRQP